jgi:hypothetical protein
MEHSRVARDGSSTFNVAPSCDASFARGFFPAQSVRPESASLSLRSAHMKKLKMLRQIC